METALESEASGESCSGIRSLFGKLLWNQKLLGGSCSGIRSFWGKLLKNQKLFGQAALEPEASWGSCSGIRSLWEKLFRNQKHFEQVAVIKETVGICFSGGGTREMQPKLFSFSPIPKNPKPLNL